MKTILNKPELVSLLQQQIIDIELLCGEYDLGNEAVISSIAEKIIMIFHNSDQTKALVNQLKLTHPRYVLQFGDL